MSRLKTIESRMTYRMARKEQEVFLRSDFNDLGNYDSIGRVLSKLINQGKIIKIGYGLYAKATISPLSSQVIPRKGLPELATEALQRLKVEVVPSSYEKAYNAGLTMQVPTGRVIAVKERIARKIGYSGKYISFEHAP